MGCLYKEARPKRNVLEKRRAIPTEGIKERNARSLGKHDVVRCHLALRALIQMSSGQKSAQR